jgi:hypothetical protein
VDFVQGDFGLFSGPIILGISQYLSSRREEEDADLLSLGLFLQERGNFYRRPVPLQ